MKTFLIILSLFVTLTSTAKFYKPCFKFNSASYINLENIYTYKIFENENKTFGYDIYENDKKFIHQPTIPGLQGNNGFVKKSDAEKVAKFAIEKLKQGIIPPTITDQELKKLNISN